MFTLKIFAVGRGEPAFSALERDYLKRTRAFHVEISELKAYGDDAQARRREAAEILARLPERFWLFVLDERGEQFSSSAFASLLNDAKERAIPGIALVIGGASGLDESVREKAKRILSLSLLTLPHRLARLVLVEQLYRASTILRGEPYHK